MTRDNYQQDSGRRQKVENNVDALNPVSLGLFLSGASVGGNEVVRSVPIQAKNEKLGIYNRVWKTTQSSGLQSGVSGSVEQCWGALRIRSYVVEKPNDSYPVEPLSAGNSVSSIGQENRANELRLKRLRKEFSESFINSLLNDYYEYGVRGRADEILSRNISDNKLATLNWLNDLMVEYFAVPEVPIGILRVVSRIPFNEIGSAGVTLACTAMVNPDLYVREAAIRAFENWGEAEHAAFVESLHIPDADLSQYRDQVASYLKSFAL